MKKHICIITIFIILISSNLYSQKKIESTKYGFSMEQPTKWFEAKKQDLTDNLDKFKLPEEKIINLIKSHKGSVLLGSFYKYNPKTHSGVIPTIQVNMRLNPSQNFNSFKKMIHNSALNLKKYFEDFSFKTTPKIVEIDNIKCVYFASTFTMKSQSGEDLNVISRTYAIPHGKYFFQVNFSEGANKEDNSTLFEKLIKTIKIDKN